MANPLTKFGTVATGILAPFALSLGNPTEAIGSNKVDLQIINPVQPTTLVERGSKSRLFNNPAALVAEAPREAIANSQGNRGEVRVPNNQQGFRFNNEEQNLQETTKLREQSVQTAQEAQKRIDESNQRVREGVNNLSDTDPMELLNNL